MENLDIIDIYQREVNSSAENFLNNANTEMNLKTDIEKVTEDTEWIQIMEETIPHIDSIFRNPNRFIINEEDIVKIELARKITVESVKHLAKHTNLIQDYDKLTGDVRPSKILNINKEESYDTYENKLIYTLIQNMKIFIERKKTAVTQRAAVKAKDNKLIDYSGEGNYNHQNVNITMHLESNNNNLNSKSNQSIELLKRIEDLETKILDLTSSEVYKILAKKHIALIRPPIKKTNVILKNVHFQYAMKLWNYMQDNMEDKSKHISEKNESTDNEELKRLINETFLLNCMALDTLNKDETMDDSKNERIKEQLTNNLIENIIELNPKLSKEELDNMINTKYAIIKYRAVTNYAELEKIFKKHIEKYIEKVEK